MKRLKFDYSTTLNFSGNVTEHCFTLRCLPNSDGRQLIRNPHYEIDPVGENRRQVIWYSRDSFGNSLLCGRISEPHDFFRFRVFGEAEIVNGGCVGYPSEIYRYESPLTKPGEAVRGFFSSHAPSGGTALERAMELSQSVYSAMNYVKGSTNVKTTAEEALASGAGVCQDYSHILLSLCRLAGIKCRYAAGLAFNNGETHAWIEIYDNSKWIGLDPTNNCLVGERYIKICHGRDHSDSPIERGVYLGNVSSTQTVESSVTEI